MEELTLDGELYLSTKRAAKITGYAKDYVGQLCREGRVQARLVGRNWYVLDSSIRDHRFGEAEIKEESAPAIEEVTEKSSVSEWNAPTYSSEPVLEVSVTASEPVLEDAVEVQEEPEIDNSTIINEMQSAWQDWFKRNDSQKVLQETLLETPEVVEAREEEVMYANEVEEEGIDAVNLIRTEQETEEEEVPVSINRSYIAPEAPIEADTSAYTAVQPVAGVPEWGSQREYVRPSRQYRRAKAATQANTNFGIVKMSLQIFFVLIMLVVIGITVIGSGYIDTLFRRDSSKYYPIQYLGGERVIEKY